MIERHINFDEKFKTFNSVDEYYAEMDKEQKEKEWQRFCYDYWNKIQEREDNLVQASLEIAQEQSEGVYNAES